MSDALEPVTLCRNMDDLYNGTAGIACECWLAQTGHRLKKRFPHPVYMVEFTRSRAFVVDQLDRKGWPAHCVRYYHHEGDDIDEFDRPGGKEALIAAGKAAKVFTLLAPTKSTKHEGRTTDRVRGPEGPRNTVQRKGSIARFQKAYPTFVS